MNLSFRELADTLPHIVWIYNSSGVVEYYNRRWYDFSGFSPDQLEQIQRVHITHPSERDHLAQLVKTAMDNKEGCEFELRLWDYRSRFYRWFHARIRPVFDESGEIKNWVGISTDIHEQKQRQFEKIKFQAIIDESPDCVIIASQEGKVIYLNRFGREMLGYGESQPADISSVFRHPHLYNDLIVPSLEQDGNWSDEIELQNHEDGFEIITHCHCFLIHDDSLEEPVIGLVANDISELKSAALERSGFLAREQAAIEASRMKSEFVANMSHEIRTPIGGIMGLLTILKKTQLSDEQRTLLQNLEQSGRTLLDLINDILDLSKIEAGKVELEIIDFDLKELLESLRRCFSIDSTHKKIPLRLEVDDSTPTFVSGDPTRLRQILMNLVSNAFKFSHDGEITITVYPISTKAEKHFIHFSVKDEGIGIEPDIQSRLFTPFTQADSSTTRRYGGTGLGLSISRHLVKVMNGQIGVKSELGKGSEFWFKVELDPSRGTSGPIAEKLVFSLAGLHFLVAEDNLINQKIFTHILKELGASFTLVSNGLEALEALKKEKFDLIFMDCQMPLVDGYEASQRIRNGEAGMNFNSIPIVAVTANALKQDKERCLDSGMSDFLTKPMSDADLCRMVRIWIPDHKIHALRETTINIEAEMMDGLMNIFAETAPVSLAKIEDALAAQEWEQLKFELHKFKSSLYAVNLKECATICQEMEKAAPTKDFETIEGLYVRLDDLVVRALEIFFERRG